MQVDNPIQLYGSKPYGMHIMKFCTTKNVQQSESSEFYVPVFLKNSEPSESNQYVL